MIYMAKIADPKPKLAAKDVIVESFEIVTVPATGKMKEAKDRINLSCKHPDTDRPIVLSSVRFEREGNMEEAALWHTVDEHGFIAFESAEAYLLRFYDLEEIEDVVGKKLQTYRKTPTSFLTIKAY